MGVIEEILANKEELLVALLKVLEGKETRATLDLNGVTFKVGQSTVEMSGSIQLTFVPLERKKAKK